MANYYVSSVGYTAVAQFAISHAYNIGDIVRQLAAPSVGNERCFRCTTGGTSGGSESAWNLSPRSVTTTQGTAVFTEITGQESFQGVSWAAPYARLGTLMPGAGSTLNLAGDTIYISSDHSETQASAISLDSSGGAGSPVRVLCATRPSSAIPPVTADAATTAIISTTGASNIVLHSANGNGGDNTYFYGITFNAGSSTNQASVMFNIYTNSGQITLENCGFTIANTSTSSRLVVGPSANTPIGGVTFRNCNVTFGNASQGFQMGPVNDFTWDGGTLVGPTVPTNLFVTYFNQVCVPPITVRNVDLSIMGAATFLVKQPGNTLLTGATRWDFSNCKINASLGGVTTGTQDLPFHGDIDFITSDSAASVAREEHYRFSGSVIADTANYAASGASDGVTHKSWKFTANSSCNATTGTLAGPDIFAWVSTTGSKTLTMVCANIVSATLKDNEFGFDVQYMGSASTPLGTFASTYPVPHSSGTALGSDVTAWTGQGGLTKQKVTKTITLNEIGWVRIRPRLSKASITVWVDPLVTIA